MIIGIKANSMETKEHITHEAGNDEAWVCVCGNTPSDSGFYACDERGNEVEPDASWNGELYVCNGFEKIEGKEMPCGRIINQNTLEVVGQNRDWKPLD